MSGSERQRIGTRGCERDVTCPPANSARTLSSTPVPGQFARFYALSARYAVNCSVVRARYPAAAVRKRAFSTKSGCSGSNSRREKGKGTEEGWGREGGRGG
eukprot:2954027-Rhodomonas_salina.1